MNKQFKRNVLAWVPALLLAPAAAFAEVHVYSAVPLIGTEEVPVVSTDGYGVLTAMYDDVSNMFYYSFSWNLESEAIAAHFHGPAERGENAGIVVGLGPVSGTRGEASGSLLLNEQQEALLLDGQYYINVHSETVPSGEIRGQVMELSTMENAAVYDFTTDSLILPTVIVPGAGVFEVNMDRIPDSVPLSLELTDLMLKDLDTPSSPDD